jgi:uncharacterized protein with HEPN domain
MKPSSEFDLLFLLRILEASEKIVLYCRDFKEAVDFFEANDQLEFNACLNLLAQIGEHARKISKTTKIAGTIIEWEQLYSFRNRVVHDYTGIDKFITFEIIQNSIPETIASVSVLIKNLVASGCFPEADLVLAQTSPYLRHVDFSAFK